MKQQFAHHARGTNLNTRKNRTKHLPIIEAKIPSKLYFPIAMHIGKPANILVEKGDKVKIGTLLAEADGLISANIISSVSGTVIDITDSPTVNGKQPCIIIENDYQENWEKPLTYKKNVAQLSREEKIDIIFQAGIVGKGGATFPTNVKLSPKEDQPIDTIIINGAECEPYSTSDYRLMVEEAENITKGIQLIQTLFPDAAVKIGVEKEDTECIQALSPFVNDLHNTEIFELDTTYPQGAEKFLIKNVTKREVPSGGLPADVGCVILNVGTTFAIYEALTLGKPLIERITTVSGGAIKNAQNFKVRIGTPINQLIELCHGYEQPPVQALHGGPMMGRPINSGKVPVTKGTSVICLLGDEEAAQRERYDCIRCSKCIDVCPIHLQPILISVAYERNQIDKAEALGAMDCIECGNCAYICPSNVPLLENIRKAKAEIRKKQEAEKEKQQA